MGHRLSAIAARAGDEGQTSLGDNSRVGKTDLRLVAMGDVDELNSAVGLLIAFVCRTTPSVPPVVLAQAQRDLLDLGQGEPQWDGAHLL